MCFLDAIRNISTNRSVFWDGINFFNITIKVRFLQIEASSECGRLCNNYLVYTDTDWAVLYVGVENRFLTHICNV